MKYHLRKKKNPIRKRSIRRYKQPYRIGNRRSRICCWNNLNVTLVEFKSVAHVQSLQQSNSKMRFWKGFQLLHRSVKFLFFDRYRDWFATPCIVCRLRARWEVKDRFSILSRYFSFKIFPLKSSDTA